MFWYMKSCRISIINRIEAGHRVLPSQTMLTVAYLVASVAGTWHESKGLAGLGP